jgi:PTS system nitrogen regulatory IIA component
MQISDLISSDHIITNLRANSKQDVLVELAGVLVRKNKILDKETVLSILLEREKLGSTGIGDGVAIPHGKLKGLDQVIVSLGRSLSGVPFDSVDGKPVQLLFLLLAPEESAGLYLRILAKLSRFLKNPVSKEKLLGAKSAEEMAEIIKSESGEI